MMMSSLLMIVFIVFIPAVVSLDGPNIKCIDSLLNRESPWNPLYKVPKSTKNLGIFPPPTIEVKLGDNEELLSVGAFEIVASKAILQKHTPFLHHFCQRLFPEAVLGNSEAFANDDAKITKLELRVEDEDAPLQHPLDEKYKLFSEGPIIVLEANTMWGAIRGMETFWQLAGPTKSSGMTSIRGLPFVVEDKPKLTWRGLLVDSSRHFHPINMLKRVIQIIAMLKMNVFHWHLTDYQSFPILSKKYPELAKGSWDNDSRGAFHTHQANVYTTADIQKVVKFAEKLGVRVVPELDIPGHSGSWGVGMNITACPTLPLTKRTLDPTNPKTFEVIEGLFEEMMELFPDHHFHLGGDEFNLDCWKATPSLLKLKSKFPEFIEKVVRHGIKVLKKNNKTPVLWNDIRTQMTLKPSDTVIENWRAWGQSVCDLQEVTNQGFENIQSTGMYLDWEQKWMFYCSRELLYKQPSCPKADHLDTGYIGAEACLWSERMDSYRILCRAMPRLIPIADRFWSEPLKTPSEEQCRTEYFERSMVQQHRMHATGLGGEPMSGPDDSGACLPLPKSQHT
eukprot:m.49358 g.49358  ORF g.49358 m.49358 type:complete len:564 (-) comp10613_c0_seq4:75-1766(-)